MNSVPPLRFGIIRPESEVVLNIVDRDNGVEDIAQLLADEDMYTGTQEKNERYDARLSRQIDSLNSRSAVDATRQLLRDHPSVIRSTVIEAMARAYRRINRQ